jgi:hypothetical protein
MYETLKTELAEIVALVETLPDRYKDRTFEVLLSALLAEQQPGGGGDGDEGGADEADTEKPDGKGDGGDGKGKTTSLTAKMRAFIKRQSVTEEQLRELAFVEDGEVVFIHEPEVTQNSKGQIQWALLLALKSGLLGGEMEVDPEDVRSICIEKGFYDKANFAKNFKAPTTAAMFQSALEPQGKSVKLAAPGEKKLADLIKTLVA